MAWAVEHQKTSAWKKILKIISYSIVFQLQAHGPHVVRHNVFSGPRTRSGKIFKIWNLLKSAWGYISLTELIALHKVHLHKNDECSILPFHIPFCFIYLFYDQIRRYDPPLTLRWGTWLDNLCFSGGPAFVVLKSTSGAMHSVPTNKSVYLSAKRTHLKVSSESN